MLKSNAYVYGSLTFSMIADSNLALSSSLIILPQILLFNVVFYPNTLYHLSSPPFLTLMKTHLHNRRA